MRDQQPTSRGLAAHSRRHSRRWQSVVSAGALTMSLLSGCVTAFDRHREELAALHAQGQYGLIAQKLDDPNARGEYGDKNRLLWWLDRGAAALALGDTAGTIENFEKAEEYMDIFRSASAADDLGKWLLNDTAAPYYGEPYEDMYVNVFKLLAQLEAANLEGGATVEARRMATKADALRDRYLRMRGEAGKQASDGSVPAAAAGGAMPTTEDGEFIESPLGTYLTAVTFLKTGERAMHEVASRRLLTSIDAQGALIGPVQRDKFSGLEAMRQDEVNVLLVAISGRGPRKVAKRFGPIPIFEWPVYFELPELVGGVAEASGARLVIDDGTVVDLALVEDLRSVATANHQRQMPLIYARTYLRSSAKAAAAFALTRTWQSNSKRGSEQAVATVVGTLAGLAIVGFTEKADLRAWELLPGQTHVGMVKLPPGEHNARIEYLSSTGGVLYAGPWKTIAAGDRPTDLTTIVEHYWR